MWSSCGEWKVGVVDVELLSDQHDAAPDPESHLVGRLFYPCSQDARHSWLALPGRRGVAWLPQWQYSWGVARFLFFRARGAAAAVLKTALAALSFVMNSTQLMDWHPGAPLVAGGPQHPVVVFSHGLGGNRILYSITCSELASQGYVVLALEHADGSASACKLAGGKGWKFYAGLGGEEGQVEKTRVRVREMQTARRVLQALNKGAPLPGLALSHGADPATFLRGALDLKCLAAMGHSYGGATTTALIAEDPHFRCGVALDPWWYAMPPEAAALSRWRTRAPLLVMPSHDWSVPNAAGQLACGTTQQAAVLEAAKPRREDGSVAGGGALLLVVSGTSHNTFADPLALFSSKLGRLLEWLGLASRLDPVLGIYLTTTAALSFLATHLPLTAEQRGMQSWEPGKGHIGLDRIRQRDAADQARTGFFASVFPLGKGLIDSVSDILLNRALKFAVKTELVAVGRDNRAASKAGGEAAAPEPQGASDRDAEPDDVVTAVEALEVALPSADPASGPHPHAPSEPTYARLYGEREAVGVGGDDAALLGIGARYSSEGVQAAEAQQLRALLGAEHIFKCEAHM